MSQSERPFLGELLQQFRKRKRLNQIGLAHQSGVSREALSLWERGYYKPETDTILYELVRVLGLTEQERDQLFEAYTVTALAVSFHNPPLGRNPYFTGRSPQLTHLHKLLKAGNRVALTQAISGLGGIGKTQLALEYAYRYYKSYHDILWVFADTYESLMASYIRLAAILHLPEYNEPDQSKVKAVVQRWLRRHTGWLLILDNIDDLNLIHQFVPEDRQGAVLITTRRQVTEPVAQVLELGLLPENDAILFLLKRTKVLQFDMSLGDASADDIALARTLAQKLGNLPLALDQAGAYILETQCGFANYIDLLQKHRAELLLRRAGRGIPIDHPESITATFTLNFQQIQQVSEVAVELLRACAFLSPDGIGEEIFVQGASELGPLLQPLRSDELLLNQAIESLRTFSLIQRDTERKTLTVHRLVQAVLLDRMVEQEREVWEERVIAALDSIFPKVTYEVWEQCERLVPHVLASTALANHQRNELRLASLLKKTADYMHDRAQYEQAELLYLRALHIREQTMGPDHLDVVFIQNGLANVYQQQGKYEQAELLYQNALQIMEQSLQPDPSEVDVLNNLATLYFKQGKYEQAEPFYQRALSILEQSLAPDYSRILSLLSNLANIYHQQGKYEQAELLYQRALHIWEQRLAPDHFQAVFPLTGLATVYAEQDKYGEAELLYQRALHIQEQNLAPDHPDLAYLFGNLAELYYIQGKYEQAKPLYLHALDIWEQNHGPNHPLLAYMLNGLAGLYAQQGKYGEAEPLYQRALRILEQHLGSEHPQMAETMHDLARLRELQGSKEEAKALYARALTIREQALGSLHPKTRETRTRLIALLHALDQHEEAAHLEVVQTEQGSSEEERKIHPEE